MTDRLSIVLGPHGQVADLRSGAVAVDGCDLAFTDVKRMPDAYRAMARNQPYDICEMAPTSYLMARSRGAPITALPIPMTRRFRHAGVQRLRDSSVRGPKDLEGRSVGLRAYSVTAAVWTRGVYADEYGLDISRVNWLTQEDENVPDVPLPANVRQIGEGESLAAMMRAGELEVAFAGLAGVGADVDGDLVELVDAAAACERDWFERTGIYPLHGVIVVRNEVLARLPWLPAALWRAFNTAKANYLRRIESGAADGAEDLRYRALAEWVGDPLPYGLEQNAASLEALLRYAHRQGLVSTRPSVADVFLDPQSTAASTPA